MILVNLAAGGIPGKHRIIHGTPFGYHPQPSFRSLYLASMDYCKYMGLGLYKSFRIVHDRKSWDQSWDEILNSNKIRDPKEQRNIQIAHTVERNFMGDCGMSFSSVKAFQPLGKVCAEERKLLDYGARIIDWRRYFLISMHSMAQQMGLLSSDQLALSLTSDNIGSRIPETTATTKVINHNAKL
mmetsp:Transcript_1857/g.2395  ORF Transcript_1857/g.2395 Transcript_1857/m.2395 type:complete len:184 (+) Transcript_1857:1-552(+)